MITEVGKLLKSFVLPQSQQKNVLQVRHLLFLNSRLVQKYLGEDSLHLQNIFTTGISA